MVQLHYFKVRKIKYNYEHLHMGKPTWADVSEVGLSNQGLNRITNLIE
jgi:hypothetical protein